MDNYINFTSFVYNYLVKKNEDKSFIPKTKGILGKLSELNNEVGKEIV